MFCPKILVVFLPSKFSVSSCLEKFVSYHFIGFISGIGNLLVWNCETVLILIIFVFQNRVAAKVDGFFVKIIWCLFYRSFCTPVDGKYCSTATLLVPLLAVNGSSCSQYIVVFVTGFWLINHFLCCCISKTGFHSFCQHSSDGILSKEIARYSVFHTCS